MSHFASSHHDHSFGKQWSGCIYDSFTSAGISPEVVAFSGGRKSIRCLFCHAFLFNEVDVKSARVWKQNDDFFFELNILTLRAEFAALKDSESMGVYYCWKCRKAISMKDQRIFGLERGWFPGRYVNEYLVSKKGYKVLFCTMFKDDHEKCIKQLQTWAAGHSKLEIEIDILELPLAQLRGEVNFPALNPSVDLVVICHESEGRTLLTDQDGLYNSLILKSCENTLGNLVVLLTGDLVTNTAVDVDTSVVDSLVSCGQSMVEMMAAQNRFLTFRNTLSESQLSKIENHILHCTPPLLSHHRRRSRSGDGSSHDKQKNFHLCPLL